jgi:hypothetical protein
MKIAFDAFKTYLVGLPNAIALLDSLTMKNDKFALFLEVRLTLSLKTNCFQVYLNYFLINKEITRRETIENVRFAIRAIQISSDSH